MKPKALVESWFASCLWAGAEWVTPLEMGVLLLWAAAEAVEAKASHHGKNETGKMFIGRCNCLI